MHFLKDSVVWKEYIFFCLIFVNFAFFHFKLIPVLFLFVWLFVCLFVFLGNTGALSYHRENATFSLELVNVTQPAVLKNGRKTAPAPTPEGELEVSMKQKANL